MTLNSSDKYARCMVGKSIDKGFNKFDELYNILNEFDSDTMDIAESWLGTDNDHENPKITMIANWFAITINNFVGTYFGDGIEDFLMETDWKEFKNHPFIDILLRIYDPKVFTHLSEIIKSLRPPDQSK